MAKLIALAGKGGTGKTTTGGMIIKYLAEHGKRPILAVDADANSNLNEVLGMDVQTTLGDIREDIARADMMEKSPIPIGMTKPEYTELKLSDGQSSRISCFVNRPSFCNVARRTISRAERFVSTRAKRSSKSL